MKHPLNIAEIEDTVNTYLDNIIDRMRNECTMLKDDDFTFITLYLSGLSVRAISLYSGFSNKYFYVKKKRIIDKIKASDVPSKPEFIEILCRDSR